MGKIIDLSQSQQTNVLGFSRVELNYNALSSNSGTVIGELAYVQESQGTPWLPGAIGGTYYPKGVYLWDGVEWTSDRNSISNQLEISIDDIDQLEFDLSQEVLNRINADNLLQSKIAVLEGSSFGINQRWEEINGEYILCYNDPNRSDKILSVNDIYLSFGENRISSNDWIIPVANASSADSSHIAFKDATIVSAFYNCEDANGLSKDINLYINDTLETTLFTTLPNDNTYQQEINNSLNIDVLSGDRIRVRGGSGGNIEDTVVCLIIKWRKA